MPQVVLMSLWRNDADKDLLKRVDHLLHKPGVSRWVWVVGDCEDETERKLQGFVDYHLGKKITLIRHDTGITEEDPKSRVRRISLTYNAGMDQVQPKDDLWIFHESDLKSPHNLVERFIDTGKCPVAGWVLLDLGDSMIFYDIWAYRANGQMFSNYPPFHPVYQPGDLFQVDSVGSCWMMSATDVRAGVRCFENACVELCQKLKAQGREIWVDPLIRIIQPKEFWVSRAHA